MWTDNKYVCSAYSSLFFLLLLPLFLKVTPLPTTSPKTDHSTVQINHPLQAALRQFFDERQHAPTRGTFGSGYKFDKHACAIPAALKKEIHDQKDAVQRIISAVLHGKFKGKSWQELALFVDLFGHRLPGTVTMERALTFLGERMLDVGMTNLHEQEAKIPVWSRGTCETFEALWFNRGVEYASLTNPVEIELNIRSMGLSVETPADGITAEIVVIHNLTDFENKKETIPGKIVLFNSLTGEAYQHIVFGAIVAAKYGAVAVLCRSPIRLVYSAAVLYDEEVPKIPAAVISRDDADRVTRMASREEDVTIHLRIINQLTSQRTSRNVLGDFGGNGDLANEFVLLMSHAGSWDVGEGAQDDGVGVILSLGVISVLKHLGLQPHRTIRTAIFPADESGLVGASQWALTNKAELTRYTAALEADMGCMKASGLIVSGSIDAACVVDAIMDLFENETKADLLAKMEPLPTNGIPIHQTGVPIVQLIGDDQRSSYWETQHTFLDSMTSLQPDELDKCLAVMASTAYVLSNLKQKLPRGE